VTAAVPDIFTGVDVIDIGCNDGRIAVDIGALALAVYSTQRSRAEMRQRFTTTPPPSLA
jgi:hypothetical protein